MAIEVKRYQCGCSATGTAPLPESCGEHTPTIAPIPLSREQLETIRVWADDTRLWGSRASAEFNLCTFARKILLLAAPLSLHETAKRDWDVLLSTLEAVKLLARNGDTSDALLEIEKALSQVVMLREAIPMSGFIIEARAVVAAFHAMDINDRAAAGSRVAVLIGMLEKLSLPETPTGRFSEYETIAHGMCHRAGCKCPTPLLGWTEHNTPRCRLCCIELPALPVVQDESPKAETEKCPKCEQVIQVMRCFKDHAITGTKRWCVGSGANVDAYKLAVSPSVPSASPEG